MFTSRFFGGRTSRNHRIAARRRVAVELLEGRQLLSTFTVSNDNDSGPGSFRQALISSNATSGTATNTIKFQIASGEQTIALQSGLPAITHPVTIDGTTQPGTGSAPHIVLDGTNAGTNNVRGLLIDRANTTLKGVAIVGFSGDGINIGGANGVTLADDYLGVTPAGVAEANGADGLNINSGAHGDLITGCVISGNKGDGIQIITGAHNNTVTASLIGVDPTGTTAMPDGTGIRVEEGAYANVIGGTTPGAGNVLSGNVAGGVDFYQGAANNVVEGNLIGTDANGTRAIPNGKSGVSFEDGSDNNVIGGATPAARNVISGNGTYGVTITSGSLSNTIEGNDIGTDATGTYAVPNGSHGVNIETGADNNIIGGTTPGAGNVISGNAGSGVMIQSGADSNTVEGNSIGTNAAGTAALGNTDSGVGVTNGSDGNMIGGTAPGAGNLLSGNGTRGVHITNGSDGNTVAGNLIGVNASDTAALGNGTGDPNCSGVLIDGGADGNTVGGTTSSAGNVIAANGYDGVHLAGVSGDIVEGNWIGTNPSGTANLGNMLDGVEIDGGATSNIIGGTTPGAGNVISNNGAAGVVLINAGAGNQVEGNTVTANGFTQPTAGRGDGVFVMCSSNETISDNTITSNRDWGVYVDDSSAITVSGNTYQGNGLGDTHHS